MKSPKDRRGAMRLKRFLFLTYYAIFLPVTLWFAYELRVLKAEITVYDADPFVTLGNVLDMIAYFSIYAISSILFVFEVLHCVVYATAVKRKIKTYKTVLNVTELLLCFIMTITWLFLISLEPEPVSSLLGVIFYAALLLYTVTKVIHLITTIVVTVKALKSRYRYKKSLQHNQI